MSAIMMIEGFGIRRDEEGRFCLNDLHQAAGGENKHRPKYWLENQKTQDFIVELGKGGIPPILIKQGLGTFVSDDMVIDYAMWISPAFKAKVVRAYRSLMLPQIPQKMSEALQLAADQARVIEEQATKIAADAPKVKFAEEVRDIDDVIHIGDMAKILGFGRNRFFAKLRQDGVLMADNKPYQRYMEREYFRLVEQPPYKDSKGKTHAVITTMVTGTGQVFLQHRYGGNGGNALTVMENRLH